VWFWFGFQTISRVTVQRRVRSFGVLAHDKLLSLRWTFAVTRRVLTELLTEVLTSETDLLVVLLFYWW